MRARSFVGCGGLLAVILGAGRVRADSGYDPAGYIEQWPGNVSVQYVLAGTVQKTMDGGTLKSAFDTAWSAQTGLTGPVCTLIQAQAPASANLITCDVPASGELRAFPLPAPGAYSSNVLSMKYIVSPVHFVLDVPAPWPACHPFINGDFDLEIDASFSVGRSIDGTATGSPFYTTPVMLSTLSMRAMNAKLTTDCSDVPAQQLADVEAQINATVLTSKDPALKAAGKSVRGQVSDMNQQLHLAALGFFIDKVKSPSAPGAVPTFGMNLAMDQTNGLLIEFTRDDIAPAAPTGCDPYVTVYCNDVVSIYCDPMVGQFALRLGSATGPIVSTVSNWNPNVDVNLVDNSLVTTDPSEEYYVCRQEASGETCVGPLTATLPHEACPPPSTPGGGGGGGVGTGCGKTGCHTM
jgi:hypothetical protein